MLVDIEAEDKLSLIQQMVDKFDSEGYCVTKNNFIKSVMIEKKFFLLTLNMVLEFLMERVME